MASFPNLKSGKPAMHPAMRTKAFPTGLLQHIDGSEQRWRAGAPLTRWVLIYTGLNGYDVSLLRDFFRTMKGAFDSTWDITIDSVLYQNCAFEQDAFEAIETRPNRWNVRLELRQVRKN